MGDERFDPTARQSEKACVLGLGKSGLAAANLLAANGFKVLVSEARPKEKLGPELAALDPNVELEVGGHTEKSLACGFVVKSPGLLPTTKVLVELKKAGKPIYSELEVGIAFCPPAVVFAVTGTNGKSTTTALLGAVLRETSTRTHVGGNIGRPVCSMVGEIKPGDALVVETSSYQLEDSKYFHPDVAAILNMTPDHLDHHGSMAAYGAAKAKVFGKMTSLDTCVFNADDLGLEPLSHSCPGAKLYFSMEKSDKSNAWIEGGKIHIKTPEMAAVIEPPPLIGAHNLQNAMAVALMAACREVHETSIQKAFRAFKGMEHRLEPAGEVKGVSFINDSKATNIDSTLTALKALKGKGKTLWVILGGLDKGSPYAPLKPLLAAQAKKILTIGSAAPKIAAELGGLPLQACETLEKAVEAAVLAAESGDIVLLSPACASFDQFKSFEDRGRAFKEIVKKHAQV